MRGALVARAAMALALGCTVFAAGPSGGSVAAQAAPTPGACTPGILPHGAVSLICVPSAGWNGDVVIWAHGFVPPNQPLGFQQLALPDGTVVPIVVQLLGYAFATTTYRQNGLAVLEGADDVRELAASFPGVAGRPARRTYVFGVSEGGLSAALLAERAPAAVSGVVAACGPIGDFREQIDYLGDVRVLFDYFFPSVIPGSPVRIPDEVVANWESRYLPAVVGAMIANPRASLELATVAGLAVDAANPGPTLVRSTVDALRYNVLETNDAVARLGGNPYDNQDRVYRGSSDDSRLNAQVQRFAAASVARGFLAAYQTTANPLVPLVAIHTTADPIVPAAQEIRYFTRAAGLGNPNATLVPVARYGHCNITAQEALAAFSILVDRVSRTP